MVPARVGCSGLLAHGFFLVLCPNRQAPTSMPLVEKPPMLRGWSLTKPAADRHSVSGYAAVVANANASADRHDVAIQSAIDVYGTANANSVFIKRLAGCNVDGLAETWHFVAFGEGCASSECRNEGEQIRDSSNLLRVHTGYSLTAMPSAFILR